MVERSRLSPNQGGCWFCNMNFVGTDKKYFSSEWDANYHIECFSRALKAEDVEAIIIFENEWNSNWKELKKKRAYAK